MSQNAADLMIENTVRVHLVMLDRIVREQLNMPKIIACWIPRIFYVEDQEKPDPVFGEKSGGDAGRVGSV